MTDQLEWRQYGVVPGAAPEIQAMSIIAMVLAELEPDEADRVASWAAARFAPKETNER